MTYVEWTPLYDGDSPDLITYDRVETKGGSGQWYGVFEPSFLRHYTYRYPAEDLVGHSGGPKIEDAFELPDDSVMLGAEWNPEMYPPQPDWDFPKVADASQHGSLPDNPDTRNEYPMADGLLDYFPNALAMVAKLSYDATQQHHPDQPMHWDRGKSTDHRNKIMRHLVDTHTVDDKGNDHWAMVCWRALAGYQTYLEEKHGYPMSRASR